MIAEMVLKEMEMKCKVPGKKEGPQGGLEMTEEDREMVDSGIGRNICRTDSYVSSPSSMSVSSITSSTLKKDDNEDEEGVASDNNEKNGNIIEGEDTMKNLRTTFAG